MYKIQILLLYNYFFLSKECVFFWHLWSLTSNICSSFLQVQQREQRQHRSLCIPALWSRAKELYWHAICSRDDEAGFSGDPSELQLCHLQGDRGEKIFSVTVFLIYSDRFWCLMWLSVLVWLHLWHISHFPRFQWCWELMDLPHPRIPSSWSWSPELLADSPSS